MPIRQRKVDGIQWLLDVEMPILTLRTDNPLDDLIHEGTILLSITASETDGPDIAPGNVTAVFGEDPPEIPRHVRQDKLPVEFRPLRQARQRTAKPVIE